MTASSISAISAPLSDPAAEQRAARQRRRAQTLPQAHPAHQQQPTPRSMPMKSTNCTPMPAKDARSRCRAGRRREVVATSAGAYGRCTRSVAARAAGAGLGLAQRLHHVLGEQAPHDLQRHRLRRVVVQRRPRPCRAEHRAPRAPCAEARRNDDAADLALAQRHASGSASSCTSNVVSARSAATIAVDSALPSRSTTAIGTRESASAAVPKTEPKNAAMRIGAANLMSSARRFEK